jgi:hypothetical protein
VVTLKEYRNVIDDDDDDDDNDRDKEIITKLLAKGNPFHNPLTLRFRTLYGLHLVRNKFQYFRFILSFKIMVGSRSLPYQISTSTTNRNERHLSYEKETE